MSFLILLFSQVYVVVLWRILVNSGERAISILDAISVFYLSALGRYIPGKIWQLVGLAYLSEGVGIESEIAIGASLLSQSLSVISGVLVSAGILTMYIPLYLVILIVFFILLFLYPPFFNRVLNWVSLKVRKKSLVLNIGLLKILFMFIAYLAAWCFYGFSFYLLLRSLNISISILKAIEFFSSSYLLGLFALFVPGGLGVREGVLAVLLKEVGVISSVASFVALLERINITITEIILGIVGLVVFLLKRRP